MPQFLLGSDSLAKAAAHATQVGPYTVLIVDDDRQNRTVLAELLKAEGRIVLAKNGEQALEKAAEHLPSLILLDILMDGMNGYQVMQRLKDDPQLRDIPVIFITALDSEVDEERGFNLGAVDYIFKPFRPSIVRARVRTQLQLIHQRLLLERLAVLDGLTELGNRRRFMQVLEQEWRRCARQVCPLSLVMIDVDSFKAYNDHYGHLAGDEVLRRIARVLENGVQRPGDLAARYGGEEFALVLPEIDAAGAQMVAERIRRGVIELGMPHLHSLDAPCVTISMGGATIVPLQAELDERLLACADNRLYEAKRSGRNCVVWAEAGAIERLPKIGDN